MLSAFPDLLNYGLFTPFVLRIALAFFLGSLAVDNLKKRSGEVQTESGLKSVFPQGKRALYGIFKIVVAFFLTIGLFTQVAALIALLIAVLEWKTMKSFVQAEGPERLALFLAMAVAISLLFSGAGFFAFDLPL